MIILFDLDGVVADFEKGHVEAVLKEKLPIEALAQNRKTWQILDVIADNQVRQRVVQLWHSENFFRNLQPIAGAIDTIKRLCIHHDIFFCTAPLRNHATCASEKIMWVQDYFGVAWGSKVVISSDKTLVHGDILIDDRPDIHGVNFKPTWQHWLFEQHYNEAFRENRKTVNWENLEERINQLPR